MAQQCTLNICHIPHFVLGTEIQGESERPKPSPLGGHGLHSHTLLGPIAGTYLMSLNSWDDFLSPWFPLVLCLECVVLVLTEAPRGRFLFLKCSLPAVHTFEWNKIQWSWSLHKWNSSSRFQFCCGNVLFCLLECGGQQHQLSLTWSLL